MPGRPQSRTVFAAAAAVTATVLASIATSGEVASAAPSTSSATPATPAAAWSVAGSGAAAKAKAAAAAASRAAVRAYATPVGPSPAVPNPHPPLGGLDPNGAVVGGSSMRSRGLILPAGAPALPTKLTAAAWMVTDLDTGAVIAARDPHGRYQPASVLKLLAGLVMLPHLPGSRVLTATAEATNAEGSAVGLVPGGKYTVDTLFRSLYLMSGNDAAMALALANGGPAATVTGMNAEARRLGAYDTVVQTPSGLDGWSQLTSAYDLTLVLRAAVDTPRLVAYDEARTARLPAQQVGKRKWGGVPLFNESANFLDTVPGAILAKTGFTGAAQHTYACAASRGGRRIGVVFLRNARTPLDQYQQAGKLLDWAYRLPATTPPVGHLVGGVTTAAGAGPSAAGAAAPSSVPPSGQGSAPDRSPAASRATTPSRRHPTRYGISSAWWAVLVIAGAVAAVGRQYGRRRSRYRRRYR